MKKKPHGLQKTKSFKASASLKFNSTPAGINETARCSFEDKYRAGIHAGPSDNCSSQVRARTRGCVCVYRVERVQMKRRRGGRASRRVRTRRQ